MTDPTNEEVRLLIHAMPNYIPRRWMAIFLANLDGEVKKLSMEYGMDADEAHIISLKQAFVFGILAERMGYDCYEELK